VAKLDDLDAQIALTSAKVELDNARAEYLRAKKLFESRQSISKSQFEELTLRFNLAQNRFDEANHRLDDTRLTAPFSGVVSRTFIDNHTLVQSNEVILSLHDLDDLEVVIDVPESLMTRNEGVGKTFAQSTVAPYSVFEISLKKYETEPDPISGTYAVTFAVDNKEQSRLLPGMSVHVYSDEQPSDADTIQIPLTSVNPDNLGNKYIWVVDDKDIVHKRTVFTGSLNGERVEIKSNLQRGEKVVVSGTKSLHEGQVVRPQVTEVY
jgi:RND family efflux transporter MFP subunit